jgi:acetyl-CoA acyltransferase
VEEIYLDAKGKKQKRNYIMDTDEGPRADTSIEVLAKLKPAFAAGGMVTAGNSSQTSDGAAFVIVMGEKMMNELGLKPIGRLVACASAGVPPRVMGIGPVAAIPKALRQVGMNLNDIDLVELNEAFASQASSCYPGSGIGSGKSKYQWRRNCFGHPLGCTWRQADDTSVE